MTLREARKAKKMSMRELSEKTGCCVMAISNYENGHSRVPFQTLAKICKVLDCNMNEIKAEIYGETKSQPCWTCKNYIDGCEWSRSKGEKPVKGWDAEMRIYSLGHNKKGLTWEIRSCPNYEYDGT